MSVLTASGVPTEGGTMPITVQVAATKTGVAAATDALNRRERRVHLSASPYAFDLSKVALSRDPITSCPESDSVARAART